MTNKKKHNKKVITSNSLPFVSVCTPTFNRRPFISAIIKCFNHQKYPKNKMEWIIIDDGTDKVEDLLKDIPEVKYYKYDVKMPLGKKRNIMHEKSKGDIIVYMDDDDYYPPERVSHAVEMLLKTPNALCAGSSEIYIWFKHINSMWKFGPYGPNHATAGTFAFKRELLKHTRYDDNASLAEEKAFLKNYTIPFVQLNPLKTILCFSHQHNTFDKRKLLEMGPNIMSNISSLHVDNFINENELKDFFMNKIDNLLNNYDAGKPDMKPDVLKQIEEINKKREEIMNNEKNANGIIHMQAPGKEPIALSNNQVLQLIQNNINEIKNLQNQLQLKDELIKLLKEKLKEKENHIKKLKEDLLNSNFSNNLSNIENVKLKIQELDVVYNETPDERLMREINEEN